MGTAGCKVCSSRVYPVKPGRTVLPAVKHSHQGTVYKLNINSKQFLIKFSILHTVQYCTGRLMLDAVDRENCSV